MSTKIQLKTRISLHEKPMIQAKRFAIFLLILGFSGILGNVKLNGQNNPVPFTFTLSKASTTSAGIFRKDSTLVRTIWNNVPYKAGTHTAYWDRKDDEGLLVSDSDFFVKIISSNVKYEWEGGFIGNTSDSMTGKSKHRYFDRPSNMAINGNTAYFSSGYAEGISSVYKFNINTPQNRTSILSNMGDIDLTTHFTATDGVNVYWAGYDAYDHDVNLVYATKVSNDKETQFSSGSAVSMQLGRTYNYAIDAYTNNRNAIPSGLAVQKTGNYLFVSHKGINELHVLNKTTGALVQTISVSAPRQLCVDMNDNLWMISGSNTVEKYTVNGNGTLSAATLSITGLSEPLALAVSPNNYIVVVIDGGSSQQLKAFSNSTASSVWTLGQSGGYSNDPAVYNDKFFFKDSARQIQTESFIAFQSDSSFWFGDPGNDRIQHFSASRNFIETIMSLPCTYSIRADPNDPTRVFNDFLEFEIDYSKKLAPNNGSWKLVRNWRKGVPLNFFGSYNVLRSVITLSNGRTYATLEDPNNLVREFVELPASGNVRFTGVTIDSYEDFLVDNDGTLRIMYTGSVTDAIQWTSRTLTGFDNNNNPIWSNPVTIATSPKTTIKDPKPNTQSFPAKTKSDKLIVFCNRKNDAFGLRDGYHLGAIKKGTNKWLWKASKATTEDYFGPMPKDGTFDIGNGVEYPGGHVYTVDNNIFWNYHGEFWKNSQTNIWNHYSESGLMVSQFGIVSLDGERTYGEQAFPMGAGNVFSSAFVKVDSNYYLYHNDESVHGALHRWKISGLNTISEQNYSLKVSTKPGGLTGVYFDGTDLNNFNVRTAEINTTVNLTAPPTQIGNSNNFSVRWSGFVKPTYSQNFTFYTNTSKGVRLWVNNVLVINRWNNTTATEYSSAAIKLDANSIYTIKMEVNGGTATLSWSSTSQAKQIIPSSALYPIELPDYTKTIDLLEGINPGMVLQNKLYGWSRNTTTDYNTNGMFWNVKTGVRNFGNERGDIHARFRDDANYSVTRDLGQALNCLTSWTINGKLNLDENFPEIPGEAGGVHIEVLDDQGKVIFRLTHEMDWTQSGINPSWIKANGTTVVSRTQHQMEAIMNQNNPFTISATSTGIVFTYAGFPSVNITKFDPQSNWTKPSTFRINFISRGGQNFYDQNAAITELSITPNATKAIITAGGPTTFCQGQSVTLTASSGNSYLWSNASTNNSIVVSSTGKYTAKVTDASGCQATSNEIQVTVNPLPSATITATGKTPLCAGDSITLSLPVSKTYLWSTNANTRTITVKSAGNYSATVTDNNGCSSTSSPYNVAVNIKPTITISADGPTTFCAGNSVNLSTNFVGTYKWTNNANTQAINVGTQGIYGLLGTDANGCSNISNTIAVVVNALPNATITPDGPTSFCMGSSVKLTAAPAASYLWSNSETTQSIMVVNKGNFSVEVTNANQCKNVSSIIAVNVNEPPKPTIIVQNDILTSSEINGNQWYLNGQIIPNATGQIYKALENGDYHVEVDLGGCKGNSDPVKITDIATSINEVNIDKFLKVYPNPNSGIFTIETQANTESQIKIYNLLGELVYDVVSNGVSLIDISSFNSGTYVVQVIVDGNVYSRKIIKS